MRPLLWDLALRILDHIDRRLLRLRQRHRRRGRRVIAPVAVAALMFTAVALTAWLCRKVQ